MTDFNRRPVTLFGPRGGEVSDSRDFKIDNSHRAYYARLILANNPSWAGLFALRETR